MCAKIIRLWVISCFAQRSGGAKENVKKPKPTYFDKLYEDTEKICEYFETAAEVFKRVFVKDGRGEKRHKNFHGRHKNTVIVVKEALCPI